MVIDKLQGRRSLFADVTPCVLYGISDRLSLFLYDSIATKFRICDCISRGPEDAFIQCEYAFVYQERQFDFRKLTVVGALVLPTGSSKKFPATGFGSPSVFLGLTASHRGVEWYLFGSPGVLLTTLHKGTESLETGFFIRLGLQGILPTFQKSLFLWGWLSSSAYTNNIILCKDANNSIQDHTYYLLAHLYGFRRSVISCK